MRYRKPAWRRFARSVIIADSPVRRRDEVGDLVGRGHVGQQHPVGAGLREPGHVVGTVRGHSNAPCVAVVGEGVEESEVRVGAADRAHDPAVLGEGQVVRQLAVLGVAVDDVEPRCAQRNSAMGTKLTPRMLTPRCCRP